MTLTPVSEDPEESSRLKARGTHPVLWSALGTLLGLVLLYLAARTVDLTGLLGTLRRMSIPWAIGVFATTVTFTLLKACRWRMLLSFLPEARLSGLIASVYAGLATNFAVAHAGDFLRAAVVAKHHDSRFSAVFASVVVERALDFLAMLVLLAGLFMLTTALPGFVEVAGAITGGLVIFAIAVLVLLLHPPARLKALVVTISGVLPQEATLWMGSQLQQFRIGLGALKNLRMMSLAIAISVVQWTFVVLQIWCSTRAAGEPITLVSVGATFVLIVLGLMLPNSPMQIGSTQLAFTIGLSTSGSDPTPALAASVIYTAFSIVPTMIIGSLIVLRGKLSLGVV